MATNDDALPDGPIDWLACPANVFYHSIFSMCLQASCTCQQTHPMIGDRNFYDTVYHGFEKSPRTALACAMCLMLRVIQQGWKKPGKEIVPCFGMGKLGGFHHTQYHRYHMCE